jgi:hypothetical protein
MSTLSVDENVSAQVGKEQVFFSLVEPTLEFHTRILVLCSSPDGTQILMLDALEHGSAQFIYPDFWTPA